MKLKEVVFVKGDARFSFERYEENLVINVNDWSDMKWLLEIRDEKVKKFGVKFLEKVAKSIYQFLSVFNEDPFGTDEPVAHQDVVRWNPGKYRDTGKHGEIVKDGLCVSFWFEAENFNEQKALPYFNRIQKALRDV